MIDFRDTRCVGHKPASFGIFLVRIDRRRADKTICVRRLMKSGSLIAMSASGRSRPKVAKCSIDLVGIAGLQKVKLEPGDAGVLQS